MSRTTLPKIFPTLTTQRIVLRSLEAEDVVAIYRHFSDPQVVRFLMDPLESLGDAEEVLGQLLGMYKAGKAMYWALTLKTTGELVGVCGFEKFGPGERGEVGFDLAPAWWGKGLMSEAMTAVIQYGFERLRLSEINAITAVGNRRAQRLLKRLGFRDGGGKKGELKMQLTRKGWSRY